MPLVISLPHYPARPALPLSATRLYPPPLVDSLLLTQPTQPKNHAIMHTFAAWLVEKKKYHPQAEYSPRTRAHTHGSRYPSCSYSPTPWRSASTTYTRKSLIAHYKSTPKKFRVPTGAFSKRCNARFTNLSTTPHGLHIPLLQTSASSAP